MADGYKVLIIGDTTDPVWLEAARCQAKLMFPNDAYWYDSVPASTLPTVCTEAVTNVDSEFQGTLDTAGLSVCSVEVVDGLYDVVEYTP